MKKLVVVLVVMFFSSAGYSQDPSTWFDFWIGEWQVSWENKGDGIGSGVNKVTRMLGGRVIQENFSALEGSGKGYEGTSLSTFSPMDKQWHQGYVDNQGVYYNFIGERMNDRFIFRTVPIIRDDKEIIQRMVFYNIAPNSFTWDWEVTRDGGKNWSLSWRINYKRVMQGEKTGTN